MITLFTTEQGNLLIRLLLAHIAADFILQSANMVKNKSWFAPAMLLHILVVFAITGLLTGLWLPAAVIAIMHWIIDSVKTSMQKKHPGKEGILFAADQLLHLIVIIAFWCWHFRLIDPLIKAVRYPILDYRISLILLGYCIVIWPLAYILRFALTKITLGKKEATVEKGGLLIGQFERIIILSFVLLGKYEAIGFLITGKGIIRFADSDKDKLASEYVLVGTMMSYALSILVGLLIKWLLQI